MSEDIKTQDILPNQCLCDECKGTKEHESKIQLKFDEWHECMITIPPEQARWLDGAQIDRFVNAFQGNLVHVSKIFATMGYHESTHPVDWWDAFKDRWFPRWTRRWFPVEYVDIRVKDFFPMAEKFRSKVPPNVIDGVDLKLMKTNITDNGD